MFVRVPKARYLIVVGRVPKPRYLISLTSRIARRLVVVPTAPNSLYRYLAQLPIAHVPGFPAAAGLPTLAWTLIVNSCFARNETERERQSGRGREREREREKEQ